MSKSIKFWTSCNREVYKSTTKWIETQISRGRHQVGRIDDQRQVDLNSTSKEDSMKD